MRLEAASLTPPPGLQDLLTDLGPGESGFSGTPVYAGELTLQQYLQRCCDMPNPSKLEAGLVLQTMFWLLNADGVAVGMVRLRHYLNDKLRFHGGHIGYFIRRDQRGKGYAKEALRLALSELRNLGESRALITVEPDNLGSIKVIERNRGRLENVVTDPETGKQYKRYWVELDEEVAGGNPVG